MSRKKSLIKVLLHYEPERTDYAISEEEMRLLESSQSNLWKEVTLVTIPLALATIINAIVETFNQDQFHLTPGIFLNSLVGGISLACCLICLIAWFRARTMSRNVIEVIKNKPRFDISDSAPSIFDVGNLPEGSPKTNPSPLGQPAPPSHNPVSDDSS